MDIVTATEDHIVRPVAGVDRKFYFLTAYDRAELLRDDLAIRLKVRTDRKQKLVDNLKLAGISGEQMLLELEDFDNVEVSVTEQNWIDYVNAVLNEIAIYTASLKKSYPDEAEAIARAASLTMADKAKLCGLQIVMRQETENPNQNSPAAIYETPGQTSNGTSGQAESATGSPV